MSASRGQFDNRVGKIVKRHRRLRRGVVHEIDHRNLIIAYAKPYRPKFPWMPVLAVIGIAILFKAYLYADLGQAAYNSRLASLLSTTKLEKLGVWIMHADPATVFVSAVMRSMGV